MFNKTELRNEVKVSSPLLSHVWQADLASFKMPVNSITDLQLMTVTVILMTLVVYGTFFKFCHASV